MKVLLVDDNSMNLKMNEAILSDAGFEVVTAKDKTEALEKLADGKFDILVTDFQMPGGNGFELAEEAVMKTLIYTAMDAPSPIVELAQRIGVDLLDNANPRKVFDFLLKKFNTAFDENQRIINQL